MSVAPAPSLRANSGACPREAAGRRVRVILRGGYDTAKAEPGGWPADGRAGCDWALDRGNASIAQWELIG